MSSPAQFSISAGPLQLLWEWQGDRFGHRLLLSDAPHQVRHDPAVAAARQSPSDLNGRVLLASVEGSPNDAWPDSPPLQECHVEPRGDGRTVALLVGRAGKSHWSLSVLADPGGASLLFEVACRLAEEPLWLGNRYRAPLANRIEVVPSPLPAQGSAGCREVFLEVLPAAGGWRLGASAAEFPEEPRPLQGRELAVAAPLDSGPRPRTVQWRYRVCVVDGNSAAAGSATTP